MRTLIIAATAVGALGAGPALAADLPARPPVYQPQPVAAVAYNWTGLYIGANGGGAFARKCWTYLGTVAVPAGPNAEGCHDPSGALAGGQVGYNWQVTQNWVFGFEAQGDWASLRASNVSLFFPTFTNQSRVDAIGLFTGRVGYAWDAVLLYVKGGAAFAHDKYNFALTVAPPVVNNASETRWGYTVGTGLEFGFAQNWSIAIEYDWVELNKRELTFQPSTNVEQIREHIHMITGRINYRFGGPIGARY